MKFEKEMEYIDNANHMEKISELDPLIQISANDSPDEKVRMKKEIGLLHGITMTVGKIVGTGIFITPKGVLMNAGSVGMSLVMWTICGFVTVLEGLIFVELGVTFPKSGGEFIYIKEAFGDIPAYFFLWIKVVVALAADIAIFALIFVNYLFEPFFNCSMPQEALQIIAALALCFLTFINCRNVQWATRVQDCFTFAKMAALVLVIIFGLIHIIQGNIENFENPFEGTKTEPGYLVLSFYSCLFSFSGVTALNCVIEEVKNPLKTLPTAVFISITIVTLIYILTNVAYIAVLTPPEILSSNAVAVSFGERTLGVMSWIIPLSVAMSTFGSLNGALFVTARLFYVGARVGHLPEFLSMISLNYFTPIPSLLLLCALSLVYVSTSEVYALIEYLGFVGSILSILSMFAMIWMRFKRADLERPFKNNIALPILYLLISVALVILPCFVKPMQPGIGFAIALAGLPLYFVTMIWQDKPKFYTTMTDKFSSCIQKLLMVMPEEI